MSVSPLSRSLMMMRARFCWKSHFDESRVGGACKSLTDSESTSISAVISAALSADLTVA